MRRIYVEIVLLLLIVFLFLGYFLGIKREPIIETYYKNKYEKLYQERVAGTLDYYNWQIKRMKK